MRCTIVGAAKRQAGRTRFGRLLLLPRNGTSSTAVSQCSPPLLLAVDGPPDVAREAWRDSGSRVGLARWSAGDFRREALLIEVADESPQAIASSRSRLMSPAMTPKAEQ